MEQPRFQIGPKAVFLATSGVAILMAVGEAGRMLAWFAVMSSLAAVILFVVFAGIYIRQTSRHRRG